MANHLVPAFSVVSAGAVENRSMVVLSQTLSFTEALVYSRVLLNQKISNLLSGLSDSICADYDEQGSLTNLVYEAKLITTHELLYGLMMLTGTKAAVPPDFRTPRFIVDRNFICSQLANEVITLSELYTAWGMLRFAAGEYGQEWQRELRSFLKIPVGYDSAVCAALAQKAGDWVYRVENNREVVITLEAYYTILRAVVTAVRPTMTRRIQLYGLKAHAYQTPTDRILTEKILSKLATLGAVVGKLIDLQIRWHTVEIKSSGICVTPHSEPEVYEIVRKVCAVLCIPMPEVYIYDGTVGGINAYTTGVDNPIIVLTRMAASMLDEHELSYVVGHECGHIMCNHVKFHALMDLLAHNLIPGADVIHNLTLGPLLNVWHRRSELSADRAGLLACQNMEAVKRAMLKMMGTPFSAYQRMRTSTLVSQSIEFQELMADETLDRSFNLLQTAFLSHPRMVFRCVELMNWVKSGEYEMLVNATVTERAEIARLADSPARNREQNEIVTRKLTDWAAQRVVRPYRDLLRGARTLMLGASTVDMAPYTTIFSVLTRIRQNQEDKNAYVTSLHIRYVDTEGPKEYAADIISQEWSELPAEAQSHFIRNGADMNYESELYRFRSR